MKLRIKSINGGTIKSAHTNDSGYDVCAVGYARVVKEDGENKVGKKVYLNDGDTFTVKPNETLQILTGISLGIPSAKEYEDHYEIIEAQIRGRSGMSLKEHSNVKLGTGDNTYTGEIGVIFHNDGAEPLVIKKGDRVAQIVFNKIIKFKEILLVDDLDSTDRGSNGFGSTKK